jgi:hypothetical protein
LILDSTKWKRYRKKPIVIEAYQTSIDTEVTTIEGATIPVRAGDWIIKGIAGELYPCYAKIFEKTYKEVL